MYHLATLLVSSIHESVAHAASVQGDQIGPIFAQWVIVFLWAFFKINKSSPHFWANFSTVKVMHYVKWAKIVFGYILGYIFSQTHLVTLIQFQFIDFAHI
jgi:hypothetical protein